MTDALGQVAWRQEYQAFGADYNGSASGNPYKYNAKQLDTEFGLYYYGARYYDPVTGRFTAPDPITFVESPYAYCGNNPASMVDPTGMITKPAFSKDDMPNMECSSDYDIGAACRGAGGSGVGWGCTDWQYDKVTGKYVRYWYVYFTSSLTDASGAFFSNYSYQARIANKHLKMDLKQYYNNYCNLWLTENDRNILNSVFSTSSQNERSITKRLPFIPHRIEYNRGEKTLIVTWRGETYI